MPRTTTSRPQYAAVTQPFGCPQPVVHCPICGKAMIDVTDDVAEVAPCPHLAFVYIGEVSDFEYRSPAFEAKTRRKLTPILATLKRFLKTAGYGDSMLALEISYGGMACGPVWYTDVYGFDFATKAETDPVDPSSL